MFQIICECSLVLGACWELIAINFSNKRKYYTDRTASLSSAQSLKAIAVKDIHGTHEN